MSAESTATKVSVELLKKYDRPGPRYTSYPTAPVWSDKVGSDEYAATLAKVGSTETTPLAIYCHIPFCKARCYYCGCNTYVSANQSRTVDYIDAINIEIDAVGDELGARRRVSQLHFGGGTPTFVGVEGLGRILDKLGDRFDFDPEAEKSMEVDPRVTTPEQLKYLRQQGFNRISLGVQDFDLKVQQASGRVQPYEMVASMLKSCRDLGFAGINFDLIYGLPHQNVERFEQTIEQTIELRPDRVAVYSFAYLPSFKANQSKINEADLPETEVKYRLFARALEMFTAAGYKQIGMDHFALPDDELAVAQSDGRLHRNFMGYTVQAAPDMIGFGMSSIGYIGNSFFQTIAKLDSYKKAVAETGLAVYRGLQLSQDDLVRQFVINSLMCNFRLDYARLQEALGVDFRQYFATELTQLDDFIDDKLLTLTPDGIQITEIGRTFVRNIAMTFDAYLSGEQSGKQPTFSRTI